MPALIGYMLAVVVMLAGYLTGLQWLVKPADPWKPDPLQMEQLAARKRTPAKPAPVSPAIENVPIETSKALMADEPPSEAVSSVKQEPWPQTQQVIGAHVVNTEAAIVERTTSATAKPVNRKRVEKKQSRRPILMVLRTYERFDGTRFSRLLPIDRARQASVQGGDW